MKKKKPYHINATHIGRKVVIIQGKARGYSGVIVSYTGNLFDVWLGPNYPKCYVVCKKAQLREMYEKTTICCRKLV